MIHSFYDFGYILSELMVLVYGLAFIQRFSFIHPPACPHNKTCWKMKKPCKTLNKFSLDGMACQQK
ncbi:hypothetical protein HMPREF1254_1095 [Prevotella sp. BV3P1]|uniref:hypothetical protein n=1 Tax=Prevotellaceae TaxID=171552 RepID=UPI0003B90E6E|nr:MULTISPECIES: hypothetical protein [Prevotellaceae]ERT58336.1 hypothetical protein HMPREF1254_1095 [Prevotella sp. BV3P1]KGF40073.1 hypothetical protein HMPREF2140_08635 [Hoylesella buccalis DNF00985]